MKILICCQDIPWPVTDGRKVRAFNLARELALHHEVHLFCLSRKPADPGQRQAFQEAGLHFTEALKPPMGFVAKSLAYGSRLCRGVPPNYILSWERSISRQLTALAQREQFDVVVAEHLFMARYIAGLKCPKVLAEHNVEAQLQASIATASPGILRPFRRVVARWTAAYEGRMLRLMQGVIAVSEVDAVQLRQMVLAGIPVVVVENGVRCDQYSALAEEKIRQADTGSLNMLFIGLMSYQPNIEGAQWFVRKVMPLIREQAPQAVFNIVGGGAPASVQSLGSFSGVRVHGYAEDVQTHYRQNSLLVVPLLTGGGSRLKVLEAFAAGTPVVSTAKGAEGLQAVDGRHLLIADAPDDFAAAVIRLHTDHSLYLELSRNARMLAVAKYDWSVLGLKFEAVLAAMTGKRLP